MSLVHSVSVDSTSSTATMATTSPRIDQANGLYEDRDHFQAIFTNDSRFFDTSLHLFKSYCMLGYIPSNEDKSRKLNLPFVSTPSFRGQKHRWRPRLFTSHSTNEHENRNGNGILKIFLTPTLLRKSNHSTSNQSDSGISTTDLRKSPMVPHHESSAIPIVTVTDDNDSEVIITRL